MSTTATSAADSSHLESGFDKPKYLVTYGLPFAAVQIGLGTGLQVLPPDDPYYNDLINKLMGILHHALPHAELVLVDVRQLGMHVLERAKSIQGQPFICSTVGEVALPHHGYTIHINRLVNLKGEIIGLGPRPGHPSLSIQIRSIVEAAGGNHIVIAEDGIFSGTTILFLVEELKKAGGYVSSVVAGFQFEQAGSLLSGLKGVDVITLNYERAMILDWVPDHDFIPFLPNCGRVLGSQFNGVNMPYYNRNGSSFSIPYLYPFCPMTKWTSIPSAYLSDVSYELMQITIDFFTTLEKINRRSIMVSELTSDAIRPRISLPVQVGKDNDITRSHQMPVTRFLREMQERVT